MSFKAEVLVLPTRNDNGEVSAGTTRVLRNGAGTPIIFVHGVGMNASVWQPQAEILASTHEVIRYDLWGHGESSLPPVDATLRDYAEQLLQVMDGCNVESAHLVGHSMGALIVLELALVYPTRCRSVSALNAVFRRSPEQRPPVEHRANELQDSGPMNEGPTIARWFGDPIPANLAEQAGKVGEMLRSVNRTGYQRTYRIFAASDEAHVGRLANLTVPALFMTGADDPNSTPRMSSQMASEAPSGVCEIIPGHRHMMALTAAGEVTARLAVFMKHIDAAASGG